MGVLEFLKGKRIGSTKKDLEVPPAPPTAEEMPDMRPKKLEKTPVERYEDRAVEEQHEILEHREELHLRKPIFITLDVYKDMMDEINLMGATLKENEDILARISEFKEDENKEYNKWEAQIKDIQKKLIFADKTLFGKR